MQFLLTTEGSIYIAAKRIAAYICVKQTLRQLAIDAQW